MEIRELGSDPVMLQAFVELPHRIYADDPKWVPPAPGSTEALLGPANPFLRHGALAGFLAFEGERCVGRIAAIHNERQRHEGEPIGLVGFFEVEDRYDATEALLKAALGWLRARGLQRIWGPMNLSIWHSYRFMTRGFDRQPFLGEPYNPPHYPAHFERFGFRPLAYWHSWDLEEAHVRAMIEGARPARSQEVIDEGYRLEPIRVERFDEELARLHGVLQEAFSENLGYAPVDLDELRSAFGGMRDIVIPELTQLIIAPDGEPAGVFYFYPDLAPAVRAMVRGGEATQPERAVFHTAALLKAHRRKRVGETLVVEVFEEVLKRFPRAVGALAKEGRTMYDKTGPSSRCYTLYSLDAGA